MKRIVPAVLASIAVVLPAIFFSFSGSAVKAQAPQHAILVSRTIPADTKGYYAVGHIETAENSGYCLTVPDSMETKAIVYVAKCSPALKATQTWYMQRIHPYNLGTINLFAFPDVTIWQYGITDWRVKVNNSVGNDFVLTFSVGLNGTLWAMDHAFPNAKWPYVKDRYLTVPVKLNAGKTTVTWNPDVLNSKRKSTRYTQLWITPAWHELVP